MDASQIAQRFPLVARPRPACPPLAERVREISELARSAEREGKLILAAAAQNKAALIASDCGMPDLARTLCWRHAEVYLCAQPLSAQEARYALEPVVNIARLLIRDGDGNGAYGLLDGLVQAARARGGAEVDGHTMSFKDLTTTEEEHHQLYQWLWTVLLGDGTRALVAAGAWDRARSHARRHRGVGQRLLDGRQVEVLGRCLAGDPAGAYAFLRESVPAEPWEHAVASCLAAFCRHLSGLDDETITATMVNSYLSLDTTADLDLFRTRLGLTALDLTEPDSALATAVATRLLREAVSCGNGYVAREVLAHPSCRERLEPSAEGILNAAVYSAGLDQGHIPTPLERELVQAAKSGATTTEHLLARKRPARGNT
nr:hypothetical protein OG546_31030 [Streptomyces antimycoticus]